MNQIVNDETEDKGTVNVGEFWESVEYKTLVRIFLDRVMQGLKIKSNFNYWAPCIGNIPHILTRFQILNTKKSKTIGKYEVDCREITRKSVLENVN